MNFGEFRAYKAVRETGEVRRIRDAPRRTWQTSPDLASLIEQATAHFKHTPEPCATGCEGCRAVSLNGAQATFLAELYEGDGLGAIAALRVGLGKTLASLLAPAVVGAQRPLLVMPASILNDPRTMKRFSEYARHWRVPAIKCVSYEFLSSPKRLAWLEEHAPDMIVCDESQALKNTHSKCTKRIGAYLRKHPHTRFVPLSGSMLDRRLSEQWHITRWAMRSRAPVPNDPQEAAEWGYAIDEKVNPDMRMDPGAILTLSTTLDTDPPLKRARNAYRDRYTQTRGVVSSLDDVPHIGLSLGCEALPLPQEAIEVIQTMRRTWCTPMGQDFALPFDLWRHCRSAGNGYVLYWDPAAPLPWSLARSLWYKFVRMQLARSRIKDSIVHIVEDLKSGELADMRWNPRAGDGKGAWEKAAPGEGVWATWKGIEGEYKIPDPTAHWIHDVTLNRCAKWLQEHERGLCWVENVCMGEALEQLTGYPFFSAGGLDSKGRSITEYTGGAAIASVKPCHRGKNLQFQYDANLLPSSPSKGQILQQLLGRTHREGQEAEEVSALFLLTCKESRSSLAQAIRDARMAQDAGGEPQKLCYANSDFGAITALIEDPNKTPEGP